MKRIALSILAAALLCPAVPATGQDSVYGPTGLATRGVIKTRGRTTVTIDTTSGPKTFNVNEIRKMQFGDDPRELSEARNYAMAGRYKDAFDAIKDFDARDQRDHIKEDVAYYQAMCAAKMALAGEGGDMAKITAGLSGFLGNSAYREGCHYFEALELLGDIGMVRSRADASEKLYQQWFDDVPWPAEKLRAQIRVAEAQLAQSKFAEALRNYQAVESSGITSAEANRQKLFAKVGRAVCLAGTKEYDQGIGIVEDVIAKEDPKDQMLFGRAYNALGACYSHQGKEDDALLAYLHVDVIFFGEPEAHAEALFHLAQLWDGKGKADRAQRARRLLKERYPASRWAQKS